MAVRGFFEASPRGPEDRLPAGHYDTGSGWPALTAEAMSSIQPDS